MSNDKLAEALRQILDATGGYVPNTSKVIWRNAQEALQAHAAEAAQAEPFTGFHEGRRGNLVVDREALHASPGYKRQIAALDKLLHARPAQDAKDAARYRWLRDMADIDKDHPYVMQRVPEPTEDCDMYVHGDYLDAAIDAAMTKESGR